jgi:hypothetical protein
MHKSLSKWEAEMTVYGYARVSTDGQTLAAQDAALHAAGCAKVYGEKQSGAKKPNERGRLIAQRRDYTAPSPPGVLLARSIGGPR